MRCISSSVRGACRPDQTIRIKIVDRAASSVTRPSSAGATIVLSDTAFSRIAQTLVASVNIEYQQ